MLARLRQHTGRDEPRLAIAATWPAISIGAFATGEGHVFGAARLPSPFRPQLMAPVSVRPQPESQPRDVRAAREEPKPRKPRKPRAKQA